MDEGLKSKGDKGHEKENRPFPLTILCLFAFVFYGLIALLFLFALFYSASITDMVLRYAPEDSSSGISVIFYTLGGFILHAVSFSGIILIWKMKKTGYWFFGISSLMIASYQLFATRISPVTTAFYIGLIVLTGIFYRKMK
jgi:hypothetical protein